MKLKLNRGVAIGLMVLLLLTVTAVVVGARRFMRRGERHDDAMSSEAAKSSERRDDHRVKELEAFKPAMASSAPAIGLEANPAHSELAHWETPVKPREDTADHAPQTVSLVEETPAKVSESKHEPHKPEEQNHAEKDTSGASLADDNRYAVPLASPPATARPDGVEAGAARSMVIQVGDSPDVPPRRDEGRLSEKQVTRMENRQPLAANRGASGPPRDYPEPARPEPDPRQNRGLAVAEPPNELAGQASSYPLRDSRYGHNQAAVNAPTDNGGYPGPAAYARDESFRRAEPQPSLAQNPLRNDGMYEVQPNDSYWTISQRVYGNGAYFRALAEVNRGKAARPDRLPPGLVISTPPVAQLEKDYPDYCPRPNRREAIHDRAVASTVSYDGRRSYVVQEGDTLTSIARNELGKVSRWAEIYQLNREQLGKDFDYLTPGMRLAMPPREGRPEDRTTRRGDEAPLTR